MSIKNINQSVTSKYASNFDNIFKKPEGTTESATGTYSWDPVGKRMVKIDTSTPKLVKDLIEKNMSGVRAINPITVHPKEV